VVKDPRVGVGVVLRRDGDLLLLRRRGAHGAGAWSTPGGNLDPGEEPASCAVREAAEETGLAPAAVRFLGVTNDVFADDGLHYVTLWFEGDVPTGEVAVSDEATEAAWFPEDALPEPLFLPLQNLLAGSLLR
jgi:8-oxo-dGTP diphosphatase